MAAESSKHPSPPRPSASLVVVNPMNEVLMVQRSMDMRSFAGAHVFPGGNYDKTQDTSLEMTALRETFEETGLLLASFSKNSKRTELTDSALDDARIAIHSNKLFFGDFLTQNGLVPDISSLLPFSEWITPPTSQRRFRTQFFITFLPLESTVAELSLGTHHMRLPSPDSADFSSRAEVISAKFIRPRDILEASDRRSVFLMPPQYYLLCTLQDIFSGKQGNAIDTPTQRDMVMRLARGTFGRMVINPHFQSGFTADGKKVITFEGDETRGGKKGRMHRVIFTPVKIATGISRVTLVRNFDITSGELDNVLASGSKL